MVRHALSIVVTMTMLDYRTAGESHGASLIAFIEGVPAGLAVDGPAINRELTRRQGGYGRGGRMQIERDEATILSGLRRNVTLGSPVAIEIKNRDARIDDAPAVNRPRPGHADLAGSLKYLTADCRNVLERASARETAARVAAGALARQLLTQFGIEIVGYVVQISDVCAMIPLDAGVAELRTARDANEVYCPDAATAPRMIEAIHAAMVAKDTVGGLVEVQVRGAPPGLGSCMRWQDKLDGRLMQAVGSVQAIKGVEIGMGFAAAAQRGSSVHDPIEFDAAARKDARGGFRRRSNNAGGIEGGMSNGEPIILRAAMKPISTLLQGMDSVNLITKKPERSDYERSDICAVPACSVVVENVVAFEIARAFLEKFSSDTMAEVRASHAFFMISLAEL